jgi:DegV family protein with EDD domain
MQTKGFNTMRDYAILTDSSCDLPAPLASALGVTALPLSFSLDGDARKSHLDWRDLSPDAFYRSLRAGAQARTSAVNVAQFTEALEPILKSGKDALVITLASALSATAVNARAAAEIAMRAHGGQVELVDSKGASLGEGLLVHLSAKAKAAGMSLAENAAYTRATAPNVCHWFTVSDPRFLRRGGRLSASAAQVAGELLHIMPVMRMDGEGRLVGAGRVRGRSAAIRALADKLSAEAINLTEQTVFISHGDCLSDAQSLKERALALGAREVVVGDISPVIGAHAGPGTLAIFFLGNQRT